MPYCEFCEQWLQSASAHTRHVRERHQTDIEEVSTWHIAQEEARNPAKHNTTVSAERHSHQRKNTATFAQDNSENFPFNVVSPPVYDERHEPRSPTPSNGSYDACSIASDAQREDAQNEVQSDESEDEFDNPLSLGYCKDLRVEGDDVSFFAPFKSREEFYFAWWCNQNPPIPASRLDTLLSMLKDDKFDFRKISFTSAYSMKKALRDMVEHESNSPWKVGSVPLRWPEKPNWDGEKVHFAYRDVIGVVKNILGRKDLQIVLKPKLVKDSDGDRIYDEPWTGERWAQMQVN